MPDGKSTCQEFCAKDLCLAGIQQESEQQNGASYPGCLNSFVYHLQTISTPYLYKCSEANNIEKQKLEMVAILVVVRKILPSHNLFKQQGENSEDDNGDTAELRDVDASSKGPVLVTDLIENATDHGKQGETNELIDGKVFNKLVGLLKLTPADLTDEVILKILIENGFIPEDINGIQSPDHIGLVNSVIAQINSAMPDCIEYALRKSIRGYQSSIEYYRLQENDPKNASTY